MADILLVNGNPLEDISILTKPEESLACVNHQCSFGFGGVHLLFGGLHLNVPYFSDGGHLEGGLHQRTLVNYTRA